MNTKTLGQYLTENKAVIETKVRTALPKHMNVEKVMRAFGSEIDKNPDLKNCNPKSVIDALLQASQLGLEVSSVLGHAYLIPFNKSVNTGTKAKPVWSKTKICQFILGYRGMISLARRSGQIISIYAQAVYENDVFEFQWGIDEKLKHTPAAGDRGPFKAAYAIAKLENTYSQAGKEGIQFDVMYKGDIDKIRARSKSDSGGKSSPWQTDYEEMAKKTVLRRLFKYLPISIEIQENIIAEERSDLGILDIEDGEIIEETKADILANKIKSSAGEEIINTETGEVNGERLAEVDVETLAKEFFGEEEAVKQ